MGGSWAGLRPLVAAKPPLVATGLVVRPSFHPLITCAFTDRVPTNEKTRDYRSPLSLDGAARCWWDVARHRRELTKGFRCSEVGIHIRIAEA